MISTPKVKPSLPVAFGNPDNKLSGPTVLLLYRIFTCHRFMEDHELRALICDHFYLYIRKLTF